MTNYSYIFSAIFFLTAVFLYLQKLRAESALIGEQQRVAAELDQIKRDAGKASNDALIILEKKTAALDSETKRLKEQFENKETRILEAVNLATAAAKTDLERKSFIFEAEAQKVREHYQSESYKIVQEIQEQLQQAHAELEPLKALSSLQQSEEQTLATLNAALAEASALQAEANALMEASRTASKIDLKDGQERAKELYLQAEALLAQANRDAAKIVTEAKDSALKVGGKAYAAAEEKDMLEQSIRAMRNVIEGYGDRYIIPTHSLLDELASDFGHTAAGEALRIAREQSRRMVEQGQASNCDYVERSRRDTAIRFVVDAFNGRVDAILSRVKHDNYGTLEQEIRDSFSLVNLNGDAFRNAAVLQTYCDARITELRWAVVAQELKLKEREEQRRIQEQIREEEKSRREYERAIQDAAKEEAIIRKAIEKARAEAASASLEERTKYEVQLAELSLKLTEAEMKNQRALSLAQQTKSGHVYIISNIGSFGDDILKIGMTRRLEPYDRIKELGDASVPFGFDVHAMIRSDDAPTLERLLHKQFGDVRVNKVNIRKEFFKVSIHQLREFLSEKSLEVTFTMAADARDFRETQALEKMTPAERQKYHIKDADVDGNDE